VIHLAYDGSLNGDWVARHAIRLAAHPVEGVLRLTHVRDGSLEPSVLRARMDRIEEEAREQGVRLERRIVELEGSVHATLAACLPRDRSHRIVCGTRIRSKRGFLAGTVSQRLLRRPGLRVVAIRVVQPGLLGHPRHFLIPLADRRDAGISLLQSAELLLHDAERVSLLRVMRAGFSRRRHLAGGYRSGLVSRGWQQVDELTATLHDRLPEASFRLDGHVVVSNDWRHEIVVAAATLHARMILLGVSRRSHARVAFADPLERILERTPCDVGICSAP
jgi:nucleotide-binding universal stress UspA family protein